MSRFPANEIQLFFLFVSACIGAMFVRLPSMTRRDIFFAITVAPEFPRSEEGARIRRRYRAWIALETAVAIALILASWKTGKIWLAIAAPYWQLLSLLPVFLQARTSAFPHAVRPAVDREANLQTRTMGALGNPFLLAGPFVILFVAAVYLRSHWAQIPERFPVHWGLGGEPNRWAQRGFMGVYGLLLMGAVLCLLLFMLNAVILRSSRQIRASGKAGENESAFRRILLGTQAASAYFLAILFSWIALLPLRPADSANHMMTGILMITVVFISILVAIVLRVGQGGARMAGSAEPAGAAPVGDRTADSYWKAGMIYVNKDDSAIFVEKRFGFGYTLDFGNPRAWWVMIAIIVIPAMLAVAFKFME